MNPTNSSESSDSTPPTNSAPESGMQAAPSSQPSAPKRRPILSGIIAAVIVLLLIVVLGLTHHKDTKAKAPKGSNYISSQQASGINGIILQQSVADTYTKQDISAGDVTKANQAIDASPLKDFYNVAGGVAYTQKTGDGNIVGVQWGTTGSKYDYQAYLAAVKSQIADKLPSGTDVTVTADPTLTMKDAKGKTYTVPCTAIVTTNANDTSADVSEYECGGQLSGTKLFMSITASAATIDASKTLVQSFAAGTTIDVK